MLAFDQGKGLKNSWETKKYILFLGDLKSESTKISEHSELSGNSGDLPTAVEQMHTVCGKLSMEKD